MFLDFLLLLYKYSACLLRFGKTGNSTIVYSRVFSKTMEAAPSEYKTQEPVYYVYRGNEHWTVKGSKTLTEIFQIDVKVVKSYLKDNKYKLSREEHLLEAVLYFSSSFIG